jgi:hypothetical protein
MDGVVAGRMPLYLDLTSANHAIAQHANALVVERKPFPAKISASENRQFLFREECGLGLQRSGIKYDQLGKRNRSLG